MVSLLPVNYSHEFLLAVGMLAFNPPPQPRQPQLSADEEEIIRCGVAECANWQEFINYYRSQKPDLKQKMAQKRASKLWVHVKERREAAVWAAAREERRAARERRRATPAAPVAVVEPPSPSALPSPPSCWGCAENQPNQLAHMEPGGCLYQEPHTCPICDQELPQQEPADEYGHCSYHCASGGGYSVAAAAPPAGPDPVGPPEFTPENPPTYEQYMALTPQQKMRWECLECCAPAIAGSCLPGSFCTIACGARHHE
jgi:hypothetical protein